MGLSSVWQPAKGSLGKQWGQLSQDRTPSNSPVPQQPQHLPHLLLLVQGQVDLIDLPPWDGIGWDEQADPWVGMGVQAQGEPHEDPAWPGQCSGIPTPLYLCWGS